MTNSEKIRKIISNYDGTSEKNHQLNIYITMYLTEADNYIWITFRCNDLCSKYPEINF